MSNWTPALTTKFYESLHTVIGYVYQAHQKNPVKPKADLRYWDLQTPYVIHPVWCGMTILTETKLPEEIRVPGAWALLLHDVLEDTTSGLPSDTPKLVEKLVKEMTFESIEEEMRLMSNAPEEIVLLKLYDKVSNLLDAVWMKGKSRQEYVDYSSGLLSKTEKNYGSLNIVQIAKNII